MPSQDEPKTVVHVPLGGNAVERHAVLREDEFLGEVHKSPTYEYSFR
jgi:hypothetical protein